VLTLNVPFADAVLTLTGGKLSQVGLAAGALCGLYRDLQADALRRQVAEIVGDELRRAVATREV
jgi:hypothetical protein